MALYAGHIQSGQDAGGGPYNPPGELQLSEFIFLEVH